MRCYTYVRHSIADDGGDRERIGEGIGILERQGSTISQGLAVIDEAFVVAKPPEDLGVDKVGRAKPATAQMNAGDVTTTDADVHDLNSIGGNTTWEWGCGALIHHNVRPGTLFSPYSVRFHHSTMKKELAMRNSERGVVNVHEYEGAPDPHA